MTFDAISAMERIKTDLPSWKGEVHLSRSCYGEYRSWSAEARDIWGHMHTPLFWGKSAEQVLVGLSEWLDRAYQSEDTPYVDDDGRGYLCETEVYLEPNPGKQTA